MLVMPTFSSYDGTALAYRVIGSGPALVCFPGGPAQASDYLGDLGGLDRTRSLVQLDTRGSGASGVPQDESTYRVDRLVEDVETLRSHLGLETMDLLGHSAGSNVATLYAAAYPQRISHLTLLAGLPRVSGLRPEDWDEVHAARSGEPWYADAVAAEAEYEAADDEASDEELAPLLARMAPFGYGRWDELAQAHYAAGVTRYGEPARSKYYAGYEPDPAGLRTRLGRLSAPVLVVAGERDSQPSPAMAVKVAALFPNASTVTIPGGGHFPWLDEPSMVADAVERFLAS
jgi:pimeloyl-ACP methyl ester carboxylesterase